MERIRKLPFPTICAVNGPAVTGGMELAIACDIIIASERARFGDTHVRVGIVADSRAIFEMGDVTLSTSLIEGKFPNYANIIPNAHTTRTVVNTGDFLKAVRMANLFASKEEFIATVEIAPAVDPLPGRVILKAMTSEYGDSEGEVDAQVVGPGLTLGFNTKYLIDALSVMDASHVVLETTIPSNAAVLRPVGTEGFTHVLMPMHLSR
jgi:DNA polymerase-3 subunit beta